MTDPMKSNITVGETNYGFTDDDLNNMTLAELEMFINNMTESVNVAQGTDINRVNVDNVIENAINSNGISDSHACAFNLPILLAGTYQSVIDGYIESIKTTSGKKHRFNQIDRYIYYTGYWMDWVVSYSSGTSTGTEWKSPTKSWPSADDQNYINPFSIVSRTVWNNNTVLSHLNSHANGIVLYPLSVDSHPNYSYSTEIKNCFKSRSKNSLSSDFNTKLSNFYTSVSNAVASLHNNADSKALEILYDMNSYPKTTFDYIYDSMSYSESINGYPKNYNVRGYGYNNEWYGDPRDGDRKTSDNELIWKYIDSAVSIYMEYDPTLNYGNSIIGYYNFVLPGAQYFRNADGNWIYLYHFLNNNGGSFFNPFINTMNTSCINMNNRAKILASKTTGNESFGHKIQVLHNILTQEHDNAVVKAKAIERLLSNKI